MPTYLTVRDIALAQPEAVEQDHHGFPSYRVGGKIFATLRANPPRLMVKLKADDQHNFVTAWPDEIAPVPGYWGRKGATFVAFEALDADLIATLIGLAWSGVAPTRLKRAG
jgi:hypothetical protein